MADDVYTATKRTSLIHSFAYMFASMPDPEDGIIDGNNPGGVLDGNDPT